jgi:CMP-N-acetylneuraminic acid synthetase
VNILGIIPARGGSKGIPDKNIYLLNRKPLICYTIEAVEQSNLCAVVVTTDSEAILRNSHHSTNKEFLYVIRPLHLAKDDTPMLPVIQHALKEYGKPVDAVMILQPTSPLRTVEDINESIRLFSEGKSECLVSVCDGIHPIKSYDATGEPLMKQIPYDKHLYRCYTRNGAIFISTIGLINSGKIFNDKPLLYLMPKTRSIDIDYQVDMEMAEALLRRNEQ